MSKYHLYTALIGIFSVIFSFAAFSSSFTFNVRIALVCLGVLIFVHSAWTLYKALVDKDFFTSDFSLLKFGSKSARIINKISLLNKKGETVSSWELYGKTSAVIGKDIGENHVDIDLSPNPYASMVEVEHAVLNFAENNWYIEDLNSQNGISIKKAGQDKVYKLSSLQPCRLDYGDVLFIGMCQLKIE